MTQQARIQLETLQTSSYNHITAISALPASGAKAFLRMLGAIALICALAVAASIGMEASESALPTLSGYLWDDRDDTGAGSADDAQVAGYLWDDRDDTTGAGSDEQHVAGHIWEVRDIGQEIADEIQLAGYLWENRDGGLTTINA